jgi:predicted patatin/cPLA2 family phospholipase
MQLQNNIHDTALIFEGGGMRGSYTAGIVNTLLESELFFDYVAGISAGSSHTVNYISRDMHRVKASFVDLVEDPNFGGWRFFFKGEGYFRAKYLYEEISLPNAAFPFDFNTFEQNPAKLRIGAFDRETGALHYFSREDIQSLTDLMKIVRSSSSMPIFMPPTHYRDHSARRRQSGRVQEIFRGFKPAERLQKEADAVFGCDSRVLSPLPAGDRGDDAKACGVQSNTG